MAAHYPQQKHGTCLKITSSIKRESVINIVAYLVPVAIISRAFPAFSFVYYLLPVLFLLVFIQGYGFIIKDKSLRNLLLLFLVFGLWCGITSFWSDYPSITLSRSAYFVFISFGSVLTGYLWSRTNPDSLALILPANLIIIVLCLFSLITNIPADSWTGGNGKAFMGLAGHQNVLAGAILFTLPALFSKIPSLEGNKRGGLILLLIMNLFILVLTYSRASILSLICGVVFFLIITKKWKILIYSSSVILLFLCIVFIFRPLKKEAVKLIEKDFPSFYSSREWMWEPSYKAALNGGLTGLGYGMSDPGILLPGTGSHYEGERYVREKGNSVLGLVEEVGLIGLVLFILPLVYLFYNYKYARYQIPETRYRHPASSNQQPVTSIQQPASSNHHPATSNQHPVSGIRHPASGIRHPVSGIKNPSSLFHHPSSINHFPSSILISAFVAFLIHSQLEAWWVGVGSVELPLFFICMGCLIKLRPTNN